MSYIDRYELIENLNDVLNKKLNNKEEEKFYDFIIKMIEEEPEAYVAPMNLSVWSTIDMNKYIHRNKYYFELLELYYEYDYEGDIRAKEVLDKAIEILFNLEGEPIRRIINAKWIRKEDKIYCSACRGEYKEAFKDAKFCPYCGALFSLESDK